VVIICNMYTFRDIYIYICVCVCVCIFHNAERLVGWEMEGGRKVGTAKNVNFEKFCMTDTSGVHAIGLPASS
jgi:hypothetical protein